MSDTTHLESIRAVGAGALGERMGIEITEATPERLVGTMPVEGNTQPYGLLHGGASVVLAETLGSFGAALVAGEDRVAVGLDINATHHRAARSGVVTGTAEAVRWQATTSSSPTRTAGASAPPASAACSAIGLPGPEPKPDSISQRHRVAAPRSCGPGRHDVAAAPSRAKTVGSEARRQAYVAEPPRR